MNDFYITVIDCSKYNIQYNETITVTVKLIDFNGEPVVNEYATITSKGLGTFSSSNIATYITPTGNVTSYTGITNNNGEFTVQYTSKDWGTERFKCNEANIGVRIVGGVKQHTYTASRNEIDAFIGEYGDMIGIEIDGNLVASTSPVFYGTIPSSIAPTNTIVVPCINGNVYGQLGITGEGSVFSLVPSNVSDVLQEIWYAK